MSIPYDRPANEPGGCDCQNCGVVFVGAEWHTLCAVCVRPALAPITTEVRLPDFTKECWSRAEIKAAVGEDGDHVA